MPKDLKILQPRPAEPRSIEELIAEAHYLSLDLMEHARTADPVDAYETRSLAHHLRLWALFAEARRDPVQSG